MSNENVLAIRGVFGDHAFQEAACRITNTLDICVWDVLEDIAVVQGEGTVLAVVLDEDEQDIRLVLPEYPDHLWNSMKPLADELGVSLEVVKTAALIHEFAHLILVYRFADLGGDQSELDHEAAAHLIELLAVSAGEDLAKAAERRLDIAALQHPGLRTRMRGMVRCAQSQGSYLGAVDQFFRYSAEHELQSWFTEGTA